MDIVSYLLELIESRKMVGITALGTFYKKKIPGRYDSESHAFFPPQQEIAFTNEVQDSEELARFISEKRNISIDAAHFYINEFVDNLQSRLAEHQVAVIASLGELKLENNQLVFLPATDGPTGSDFYGFPKVNAEQAEPAEQVTVNKSAPQEEHELPPVEPDDNGQRDEDDNKEDDVHQPVENIPPVQEEITEIPAHPVTDENIPEPENATQNALQETEATWKPTVNQRYEYNYDDDDDDDNDNGRIRQVLLKVLLGIVIVVVLSGILYLFFPAFFDGLFQFKPAADAPQQMNSGTGPAIMADTLKIDSNLMDTAKAILAVQVADTALRKKPLATTTTYEIIGGAMKTQKKADQLIAGFAAKGIAAKKLETAPGRLIKISLGTFTDPDPAKKKLDSLKKKLKNPEIYIQTIKPKN